MFEMEIVQKEGTSCRRLISKHFLRVWVLDLGYKTLKKCFEMAFWKVGSAFQNLRLIQSRRLQLTSVLDKPAFWRWSKKRGLRLVAPTSKSTYRISSFVSSYKLNRQVCQKEEWHTTYAMRCFYWMMPSFETTLPLPNEDFGWSNQPFLMRFRSTFQGSEYAIWATIHRKLLRKRIRKGWFGLSKSSFGEHQRYKMMTKYIMLWSFVTTACSPNEHFGRMNKRWHPDFQLTFQWFVDQIDYSRPWKVLPSKSGFHPLFLLPKSSFGEHKIRKK